MTRENGSKSDRSDVYVHSYAPPHMPANDCIRFPHVSLAQCQLVDLPGPCLVPASPPRPQSRGHAAPSSLPARNCAPRENVSRLHRGLTQRGRHPLRRRHWRAPADAAILRDRALIPSSWNFISWATTASKASCRPATLDDDRLFCLFNNPNAESRLFVVAVGAEPWRPRELVQKPVLIKSKAPRDPAAWTRPCLLCTSCTCSLPDRVGRCSPLRNPCTCSFSEDAGRPRRDRRSCQTALT